MEEKLSAGQLYIEYIDYLKSSNSISESETAESNINTLLHVQWVIYNCL